MTVFTDHIRQMSITVSSPDRNIVGRFQYSGDVEFDVRDPDSFDDYDQATLAMQVGEVVRGLFAGRDRAMRAALEKAGRYILESGRHPDAHRRRYRAELEELIAAGASRNGKMTITARGTTQFTVTIADDALREWNAATFKADLLSAYRDFTRHRNAMTRALKRKFFH